MKSKSHGDSPHSPWRVRELESEGMGDRVISNTRRKGSVKTKDLTGAKAGHWNTSSPNAEDALQEK